MAAKKKETWSPTDHVCRECGGRIVQVTNAGPTGGGNPVYRCADCGIASSGHGPACVCWCGMKHKGQHESAYRCIRVDLADSDPAVRLALMRAGFPTKRSKVEIAVISEDGLRWAAEQIKETASA